MRGGYVKNDLHAWIRKFCAEREAQGLSTSTQRVDRRVLEALWRWVRASRLDLEDLTRRRMAHYVGGRRLRQVQGNWRAGQRVSPSTFQQELGVLHVFFRYLVDHEVLLLDPVRGIHGQSQEVVCGRGVFSISEVEKIFGQLDGTAPWDQRDRALVGVLYGAGLRVGEALALDLSDYNAEDPLLWIRCGKGNKGRIVPLGPTAAHDLDEYLNSGRVQLAPKAASSAVFVNRYGRRLGKCGAYQRVRQHQRRAGIHPVRGTHAFRHAFATHMLRNGADLRLLQRFLGHKLLSVTARYTHLDVGDLRKVLLRAHPRERGHR